MIDQLKKNLASQLIHPDQVKIKQGIPTGFMELDQFLPWNGFPQGGLSLILSSLGRGGTTLWSHASAKLTQQKKWVAWINSTSAELCPWSLKQSGADLSRLLVVSISNNFKNLLWVIQELLSISLFEFIGCDLGPCLLLEKDIQRLSRQARRFNTALVFISTNTFIQRSSFYHLILNFNGSLIKVERARHRLTPHLISRKNFYANLMPQLTNSGDIFDCQKISLP